MSEKVGTRTERDSMGEMQVPADAYLRRQYPASRP